MYSFSSLQSQAVYQLSNVATVLSNSARNAGSTPHMLKRCHRKNDATCTAAVTSDPQLSRSFEVALEQCTELGLAELRRIRERLLAALAPPALRPQWQQVSHVSGASFFENKHGFAAASAAAAGAAYAHVDCDVLLRPLFNNADRQQRRGIVTDQRRYFKTNRSERVTRLSGEADDETTTTTKIQMLGQLTGLTSAAKDAKATGTLLKSVDKNAKLKQILEAAESLSPPAERKRARWRLPKGIWSATTSRGPAARRFARST
ncbi:PREDICTED: uncharacterized protein LOC106816300 [Priapulus caudatus]|uniref:Uncharacterized protein LOC106816300 n=1 Tax=Priapulus caudatus TaxID=37621 RepID=A0ABM1EVZ6_PRICU|nr:PREDICTED: uncharacterized protein LOC106816300 [Priapulus caudatus]